MLFSMLPTIQFNNHPLLKTDEIDNVTLNGLLPLELCAFNLSCSESTP